MPSREWLSTWISIWYNFVSKQLELDANFRAVGRPSGQRYFSKLHIRIGNFSQCIVAITTKHMASWCCLPLGSVRGVVHLVRRPSCILSLAAWKCSGVCALGDINGHLLRGLFPYVWRSITPDNTSSIHVLKNGAICCLSTCEQQPLSANIAVKNVCTAVCANISFTLGQTNG